MNVQTEAATDEWRYNSSCDDLTRRLLQRLRNGRSTYHTSSNNVRCSGIVVSSYASVIIRSGTIAAADMHRSHWRFVRCRIVNGSGFTLNCLDNFHQLRLKPLLKAAQCISLAAFMSNNHSISSQVMINNNNNTRVSVYHHQQAVLLSHRLAAW